MAEDNVSEGKDEEKKSYLASLLGIDPSLEKEAINSQDNGQCYHHSKGKESDRRYKIQYDEKRGPNVIPSKKELERL